MKISFIFNRTLVLRHFAKTEEQREANKSNYYKNRNAGLKAENTRLRNQLTYNRNCTIL